MMVAPSGVSFTNRMRVKVCYVGLFISRPCPNAIHFKYGVWYTELEDTKHRALLGNHHVDWKQSIPRIWHHPTTGNRRKVPP